MKKIILLFTVVYFTLSAFMNTVKADNYNTAVIGHVISETIKGTDIDHSKLLEQELQKLAHNYAIEMANILQTYLPSILDGIAAELRSKTDNVYKCNLLKDGGMKDGCYN